MNFKGIATVGLGVIVGLMIDHMLTKQDEDVEKKANTIDKTKEEIKKYATYLKSCSGDKDTDIDYVTDDELTSAMEISKDDTPDNVDMLFIDIIRFDNLSAAYSTMGEVMRSLENGHSSVSVHDILGWLTKYDSSDDTKRYVLIIKWQYGSKLENYGWVDPSDFAVIYNNTLDCYTITTVVPVRLQASCDEEE